MSKRYIGGYLTTSPPAPSSTAATGVWSLTQQMQAVAAGNWPAPDPYYANVSLLLHCDGVAGSTTFLDNSPSPKTMTANGNAKVSTSTVKFGTGSAVFDGSGDYISTPSDTAFAFGFGAFTIEGWVWVTSTPTGEYTIIDFRGGEAVAQFVMFINSSRRLSIYNENTGTTQTSTSSIPLSVWTHFALVRDGNTFTYYIGGVSAGATSALISYAAPGVGGVRIGLNKDNINGYIGNIDDLRVTKGVARYTANFTPPTAAFPNF